MAIQYFAVDVPEAFEPEPIASLILTLSTKLQEDPQIRAAIEAAFGNDLPDDAAAIAAACAVQALVAYHGGLTAGAGNLTLET